MGDHTVLTTTDPRTREVRATAIDATDAAAVAEAAVAAQKAFAETRWSTRDWRAGLLEAIADALEEHREDLVDVADRETGLGRARLTGEVGRSAFQFRLFAEALREGSYLEATIDHAETTELGPQPEIRRMLVPIGPVAVFGSSNFPFAFSVAGGDTASALAGGNTVVLKAHGSHLETSARSFAVISDAAAAFGAPAGTVGIVYGTEAGRVLVADPRIRAVGFTGSLTAGRALIDIINHRDEPIPFYGELSSLNPLVITPAAAAARAEGIADGLFASFTLGAGQFCTKPGVAFVPAGPDGDRIVAGLAERTAASSDQVLLNERIATSFGGIRDQLIAAGAARIAAAGRTDATGFSASPTVLALAAADLSPAVAEEAFGPLIVVARYDDLDEVYSALDAVPDSLTATIHHEPGETVDALVRELAPRAGRIVFNGYPTGVRVSWGQHHGGTWPSTNSQHTSVGVSAIRRFLRPIAFQGAPQSALPSELRDENPDGIPRRVDGTLTLGAPPAR
jgi:NADP-dependent aldehyde dehydrogenase